MTKPDMPAWSPQTWSLSTRLVVIVCFVAVLAFLVFIIA